MPLQTLPMPSLSWGLSFEPNARQLAGSRQGSPVEVWDWQQKNIVHRLSAPNTVLAIDWHPNGRWLAGACYDGRVYVWDVDKEETVTIAVGHKRSAVQVYFSH